VNDEEKVVGHKVIAAVRVSIPDQTTNDE
jgi:hypothetical protein